MSSPREDSLLPFGCEFRSHTPSLSVSTALGACCQFGLQLTRFCLFLADIRQQFPGFDFGGDPDVPGDSILSCADGEQLSAQLGAVWTQPNIDPRNFTTQWIPPPEVIGHGTSLGLPGTAGDASTDGLYDIELLTALNPSAVPQQAGTTQLSLSANDVWPAAEALPGSNAANMNMLFGLHAPTTSMPMSLSQAHFGNYTYEGHGLDRSQSIARHDASNYGRAPSTMPANHHLAHSMPQHVAAPEIRWGSDMSFNRPNAMPSSNQDTLDAMRFLRCLQPLDSAMTTRAATPVHQDPAHQTPALPTGELMPNGPGSQPAVAGIPEPAQEPVDGSRSRKRGRDVLEAGPEEDRGHAPTGSSTKQRRRSTRGETAMSIAPLVDAEPNDKPEGRRKSAPTRGAAKQSRSPKQPKPPKPRRANLTEEQKRDNHIKSEQRRRNSIKKAWEHLGTIVPDAGPHRGREKTLAIAGDWLEELLKGNDELRARLAESSDSR